MRQPRQATLFSLAEGRALRDKALGRFEGKAPFWLAKARAAARAICLERGSVTSDDILEVVGPPVGVSLKVMGAVFKGGFRQVGFRKTRRPSSHARNIGVWTLKEVQP